MKDSCTDRRHIYLPKVVEIQKLHFVIPPVIKNNFSGNKKILWIKLSRIGILLIQSNRFCIILIDWEFLSLWNLLYLLVNVGLNIFICPHMYLIHPMYSMWTNDRRNTWKICKIYQLYPFLWWTGGHSRKFHL